MIKEGTSLEKTTKVVLVYTSNEGQTEKVMAKIQTIINQHFSCDRVKLTADTRIDLNQYQAILIGSSIRYGFYHKWIKQFIHKHHAKLNTMYGGFLGINMVARKSNKNTPETNLYTRKFLAGLPWQPQIKAVFAGALYYPRYNWFDKFMIRFIMWLGKGDTDTRKPVIEYTDWDKVDAFAEKFKNECLKATKSAVL